MNNMTSISDGFGAMTCDDKNCAYEWFWKPTKKKKPYYAQCPQCRKYIRIRGRVLD